MHHNQREGAASLELRGDQIFVVSRPDPNRLQIVRFQFHCTAALTSRQGLPPAANEELPAIHVFGRITGRVMIVRRLSDPFCSKDALRNIWLFQMVEGRAHDYLAL